MAKKASSKPVKVEIPQEDILEDVIPTTTTQVTLDPLEDDDPFSSGVEGAVTPKRVEPDDLLDGDDDDSDDFGQVFLQKDKEISDEFLKKVEEASDVDTFGHDKIIGEYESKIADLTTKLGAAHQEIEYLKDNPNSLVKPATISDQFDQLYQSIKVGRAFELLSSVQKDYLNLKYNSYTDKEKKEIELHLKDSLRERFEGKIKAAKLIYKEETKGKP